MNLKKDTIRIVKMLEHKQKYNYNYCEHAREKCVGVGKRKKSSKERLTKKEAFFLEFSREIDIFGLQEHFPEWIYNYREEILSRVGCKFRVMCQFLKDAGIEFYIKFPIEINGKWKFADVFIPGREVVVLLLSERDMIGLPCHSKTDKELWFSCRYKTVGVCTYEVGRTMEILSRVK